ncbi:hypothetical protein [Burkholderia sp. WTPI3]|nr:hypothetical protein [Burkholderia sp. WTPI3]PZR41190.1 MAG: hypothetical protein DI523_33740 [Paraburkholderia fungorum]
MDFEQYRKQYPASRTFQRYTSEQRANHASSHRQAEQGGFERFRAGQHAPAASIGNVPPIHLTYTGPLAGTTLCGAPRGDGPAHHAVYAPVQLPSYRAQCCRACLSTFAAAWAGEREKPDWVAEVLSADPADLAADQLSLFPSAGDSHAS